LKASYDNHENTVENNIKLLKKKKKNHDGQILSKEDYKKKKRLETYGL